MNVEILEMQTDKDYIHILADIDLNFGVMKFIKTAKGRNSRILRNEFAFLKSRLLLYRLILVLFHWLVKLH